MLTETELKQLDWLHPPTCQLPRTEEVQAAYDVSDKEQFLKFVKSIKDGEKRFVKNDFPYSTAPHIKHSCVWYKGSCTPEDVIEFLKENKVEYITFWENPAYLKSIKEVSHYHVFHY